MAGVDDDTALAFWVAEEKSNAAQAGQARRATHATEAQELFTLDSRFLFTLKFLGRVSGVRRSGSELIEYIDEQKLQGNVAHVATAQDAVRMCLTRYGVKVTDINEENVIVVETGKTDSDTCVYFLYQARSEDEASRVCAVFGKAFHLLQAHVNSPT
ncbi:hypothetical protein PTSG_07618 [Salpingoeca rosetta]|uniref:PID domain-containing protein n=1 Tax=Salpingoeca rosetta (strain ATCC 50818 / BSB-021) TaxID=946362 RepID=F2UHA2_SALR5|nr:uncharacterized protein PTSG_07618 [Salpingoeca rosetta]EGD76501.1 hypothetical protein PTSG_07618 [Salpingoeca rosetta]|eukprot:XP_004991415.1 hypothetical protein PTSG_07618 [Salpingoeca rosetta]